MNNLDELFTIFSLQPKDRALYERAFTHASCNVITGQEHNDYERLEFMGDAVLDMLVAEIAYTLHPEMDQGNL
ncbi:MAG: ribonuclease III, partial [Firmicutes bacterium]|nr:ribonuclease III [Bacillota bacterium]